MTSRNMNRLPSAWEKRWEDIKEEKTITVTIRILQVKENSSGSNQYALKVWPEWANLNYTKYLEQMYVEISSVPQEVSPESGHLDPNERSPEEKELWDIIDGENIDEIAPKYVVDITKTSPKKAGTDPQKAYAYSYYWAVSKFHIDDTIDQLTDMDATVKSVTKRQPGNKVSRPANKEAVSKDVVEEKKIHPLLLGITQDQLGMSLGNAFGGVSQIMASIAEKVHADVSYSVIHNDKIDVEDPRYLERVHEIMLTEGIPYISDETNLLWNMTVKHALGILTDPLTNLIGESWE